METKSTQEVVLRKADLDRIDISHNQHSKELLIAISRALIDVTMRDAPDARITLIIVKE